MTGNSLNPMGKIKGELVKLTFVAFPDNTFEQPLKVLASGFVNQYSVMINPSSISRSLSIKYDDKQAIGQTISAQAYKYTNPETWSFDFIIDGTGIATHEQEKTHWRVALEIEHFLAVVYGYSPATHRHPFVAVFYAGHIFKGVVKSLNITYDMFYPDGLPLRAKVSCSFDSAANPKKEEEKIGKNSPDLTHRRMLKESETLVAKSFEIYDSNDYYVKVARANGLNNFRKIEPGTDLYFPPLKNK